MTTVVVRFRTVAIVALTVALGWASRPGWSQQRDLRFEVDSTRRVALVIGNNDYRHAPPLRNAGNDAEDLAAALRAVDFDVEALLDADLRTLDGAVDRFISRISPGDVALFHYSGHGMQANGENYLIPVDFRVTDLASVRYDAYSASKLHDRMAGAGSKLSIVTLDACRNNGFESSRSTGSGLAGMNAAEGAFIAFATGPGMTADDNHQGRNGLFTGELLRALDEPGLSLDEVFNRVRQGVYEASGRRQLPWSSSSVIGGFYFRQREPEPAPEPPTEAVVTSVSTVVPEEQAWRLELAFWEAIRGGDNPAMFESYLNKYPEGHFADLARIQLDALTPEPEPVAETAPAPPPEAPEPEAPRVEAPAAPNRTVSSLPLVRGSLGVETRVARNIEELQLLADSGDRSYSIFALPMLAEPQSVGTAGWKLQLERSEPKRDRFTLYVVEPAQSATAPMKRPSLQPGVKASELNQPPRHEHKNAAVHQPIQFNRSGPNACDEIVVLSVEANRVVGYLAERR
jgi:hypothetical protein